MIRIPLSVPAVPEWAKLVALPLIGAFAKHLWDRYRNRLSTLRWTASYQAMAFATEDTGWGKVELLYDGSPAQNLHMAYVQLQNASSRDLSNLRIDLIANENTTVLRSAGALRGGANAFRFSDDYSHIIQLAGEDKLPEQDRGFWLRRSSFAVPVLNRGATADFKLLLARFDYATPSVTLANEHQGVRVLHEPPVEMTLGVRVGQAIVVGIVTGIGTAFLAYYLGMDPRWLIVLAWVLGAIAQHIGATVVRVGRWLMTLAD